MTPDERRLISGLFDRMRDYGAPEKDREAEALINQSVRANPDAAYMLVQSVLVQEQALEAANGKIQQLEDQLRELDGEREPRSRGGFLSGGLFGGRSEEERRPASVPPVGARATPSAYGSREPWSRGEPPPPPQPGPPPAPGGFMRSALATAAGVAGGMLVAESLRNMLGGAHANQGSGGGAHGTSPLAGPDSAQDSGRGYSDKSGYVDERDNDPGTYDQDNDPGYDGGDMDI